MREGVQVEGSSGGGGVVGWWVHVWGGSGDGLGSGGGGGVFRWWVHVGEC